MLIADWDDAYANRAHVPDAMEYIEAWPGEATAYREAMQAKGRARLDLSYGPGPRNRVDLFLPDGVPRGLVVFVHGGYWMAFDKSVWSQFATGMIEAGWAVAIPSYTLAPDARIAQMAREVAAAIAAMSAEIAGPIRLVGHSAGGHLVARVMCDDGLSAQSLVPRVEHVLSISGVHDLRPLLRTSMRETLRLDAAEAQAESPAFLHPCAGLRVTAWVGGDERPEFVRQTTLLANVWTGLGADMAQVKEPGRHHFNVIEGLKDTDHPLTRCLLE